MGILNHPKLNAEALSRPMTEAESKRLRDKFENRPAIDWRKFVADAKAHPEHITLWDMPMSFEEFARRVEAGEYD